MKNKKEVLFVIFGATGDLAKKKLFPALYWLQERKELDKFGVVAIGRKDLDTEVLIERSLKNVERVTKKGVEDFKKRVRYVKLDFDDDNAFHVIRENIESLEKKEGLGGNRLFYLATMPEQFEHIVNNLKKHKLCEESESSWKRVVFEKPFGKDLNSAMRINKFVRKVFDEKQIYRIDHYLGKELVSNISTIRFTNKVIEPLWDNEEIDHVQIILAEDFGVEERGAYYDEYGALKDVFQNHVLQLFALIGMEPPKVLQGNEIRDEKLKVLKKVSIKDFELGQYEKYDGEPDVKDGSKTETLVVAKAEISNKRWKGVPFYFLMGKYLPKRIAEIYIQFKQPECLLFGKVCNFSPNYLNIKIQPDEGIHLQLNSKEPGRSNMNIVPIHLDFRHSLRFGPNTPDAYENLLLDVVNGDQSVFVREDEIEEQWKIVDKMEKKKKLVKKYERKRLPEFVGSFIKKDGRRWFTQ